MAPTKYLNRPIPVISLADFENRIDEIAQSLCAAAEDEGFFCITEHGISLSSVEDMFANSARFFSLPDNTKAEVAFASDRNAGWEKNAQIRPSTGVADRKESYQMQFGPNMDGKWLSNTILPEFQSSALDFMHQTQAVSEKLMTCFARGLGFDDDYFIRAHDIKSPESQTVCRLLHYFETPIKSVRAGEELHRAGAHTDWDLLTLLFQKEGQSGLEICPGREVSTSFGHGDTWTKVEPTKGAIICNIGDLLMSWSDDRFKSTFHRVKAPTEPDDYYGERYSIAFFNQPCRDALIQGPKKKYPPVTGAESTKNAMKLYYSLVEEKRRRYVKTVPKV
ncbi:hypothetical protein M409DRAFT_65134 [Zasmidium cellare ATCC 36951]|uniref:Fe2OG dioxygenase domain-containing protein n=1 Tax=Zasmidium cellare ATCC 36951 TaxID=1080233 RepID=A0A6A6CSF5_ZASCE|nr:uncharacterized protein M409DRAFT_65134 [Zasmidium cellare ATCC 36951]KAF2168699.1 hypothetical protein M409DRAFT_65134 [Zasmidium cellare ATCC 36951]